MKKTVLATGVVALCVGVSQADVLFMAPGISAVVTPDASAGVAIPLVPAIESDADLKFTKYEITAIHCVLKVNNPGGSMNVHSNGNFLDGDVTNELKVEIDGVEHSAELVASNEKDVLEVDLLDGQSPVVIESEGGIENVQIVLTQTHSGTNVALSDDSYIVVEGSYSLDGNTQTASIGQTEEVIMSHDSTCNMTWTIGTSPQGGPNNGYGNNEDSIDPSNQNYITMIGQWYPASSTTQESLNGVIIVDDDEM